MQVAQPSPGRQCGLISAKRSQSAPAKGAPAAKRKRSAKASAPAAIDDAAAAAPAATDVAATSPPEKMMSLGQADTGGKGRGKGRGQQVQKKHTCSKAPCTWGRNSKEYPAGLGRCFCHPEIAMDTKRIKGPSLPQNALPNPLSPWYTFAFAITIV